MKPISKYLDDAIDAGTAKNDSDIARKIGVTRAAVSDWRTGRRAPDDDQAVKLAGLLGKDTGEILAECGAARAKTPETRQAWERIAARMAASVEGQTITVFRSWLKRFAASTPRHHLACKF